MNYAIDYFHSRVKSEIESWPDDYWQIIHGWWNY